MGKAAAKSSIPKTTIYNLIHCFYDSVKLRIQGFEISISAFFRFPSFDKINLDS